MGLSSVLFMDHSQAGKGYTALSGPSQPHTHVNILHDVIRPYLEQLLGVQIPSSEILLGWNPEYGHYAMIEGSREVFILRIQKKYLYVLIDIQEVRP